MSNLRNRSVLELPVPFAALRGLVLAAAALALCDGAAVAQGTTERVSLRSAGVQGSQRSLYPDLSADGRYVAFQSFAPDLVPGDTNASWDVFRRDRTSGAVLRVSVGSGGAQSSGSSQNPSISADGSVIAFDSGAGDLVPGDTNNQPDVFVHDVGTGLTTRVSVDSAGQEAAGPSTRPALSADGRYVAFQSFAAGLVPGGEGGRWSIYVHDRQTGTTSRVSVDSSGVPADDHSTYPAISGDGRLIAFTSEAANLVAGDTNGFDDVFVHDTQTGVTRRVSVGPAGAQGDFYSVGASISADGTCVGFVSFSANLVPGDTNGQGDLFVHELASGQTSRVSIATGGAQAVAGCFGGNLSADGRYAVFESTAGNLVAGDTNGVADVFVHDRQTGVTTRASVAAGGGQAGGASHSPRIAADGRRIVFHSEAVNLAPGDMTALDDVYLHDRIAVETTLQSVCGPDLEGNGASAWSQSSNDGRYVAFSSVATDLVAGDTNGAFDVFVRDRLTGTTERVSVSSSGVQGDGDSNTASLSADGRFVAFMTWTSTLVPAPAGQGSAVLVHDRVTGQTERASVNTAGVPANSASEMCEISRDGRYVVFMSLASNLVAPDTNGRFDVFVRDRVAGQTLRASLGSTGAEGNEDSRYGSISEDGRYVAFHSRSGNLVPNDTNGKYDVFVRDLHTSQTTRVSVSTLGVQGDDSSGVPHISADGRFVTFHSSATNLVTGDTNGVPDIFVHDRLFGETRRVSVSSGGGQANDASEQPRISADGRWVCFRSSAFNLISGDVNGAADIFVHDRMMGQTHLVSVDENGMQVGGASTYPRISDDGRFVTFTSDASGFVAGDTNGVDDVFLRDRTPLVPTPFCYGDGSEAACPCANAGAAGHGCDNAQGTGGVRLGATGTQAANDVVLHGTGYPPASSPGVIVMRSKNVEPVPVLFGDGQRCVAAVGLVRLAAASASGGTSTHPIGHGAGPGTFHYQLWYRNTPATFCTSAAFNLSSGLSIVW